MHVSFFFARSRARRAPRPQSVRVGGLGRGGPHPDRRIEIYLSQTDTRHGGMRVDRCAFRAAGAQHQQRAPASRAHATRRRSPDHTAHTRVTPLVRFSLKYRVKRGWVQTLRGVPFTLYDSTVPYVTPQERFASHTCIASRAMCISGHAPRVPSASPPSSGRGSIAPQDSPATRLTWLGLGLGLGLGLQTLPLTLTP